jgi:hypothetical protein
MTTPAVGAKTSPTMGQSLLWSKGSPRNPRCFTPSLVRVDFPAGACRTFISVGNWGSCAATMGPKFSISGGQEHGDSNLFGTHHSCNLNAQRYWMLSNAPLLSFSFFLPTPFQLYRRKWDDYDNCVRSRTTSTDIPPGSSREKFYGCCHPISRRLRSVSRCAQKPNMLQSCGHTFVATTGLS